MLRTPLFAPAEVTSFRGKDPSPFLAEATTTTGWLRMRCFGRLEKNNEKHGMSRGQKISVGVNVDFLVGTISITNLAAEDDATEVPLVDYRLCDCECVVRGSAQKNVNGQSVRFI